MGATPEGLETALVRLFLEGNTMDAKSITSLCDDFYADMFVNTQLELPTGRETVLTFFERLQKQYPSMVSFYRSEPGQYCLEEDRNLGQYRWVNLESNRIGSGGVNPDPLEEVYKQDRLVLDLIPYMLGVSPLDIESLDVSFSMDFLYSGNQDEVIAEALFGSTAFGTLLDWPDAKAMGFSPAVVVALSEDTRTQARISVESKTSVLENSNPKSSSDDAITLSLTVRQFPPVAGRLDPVQSFTNQCRLAEELMTERIVPYFVQPLIGAIGQRRSS
jgi:hypothetical protein